MSAGDVLQSILLQIGLDNTTAELSGSDYEIRQIKEFMNDAGREISSRVEWADLYATLTVGGGVSEYTLPDDFQEMAEGGAVRLNKSGFYPVRAVVSPEQWAMLSVSPSSQNYYHLAQGKVLFSPTLDVDGAIVTYVSKNWVADNKDAITENADVILIPESLLMRNTVMRWKRQKGLPFDDILAEYNADLETYVRANRGHR